MAGATLYQPITQQWKLASGIKVADIDSEIALVEYDKVQTQVINGVEKLVYGIMSVRKSIEEKTKRIEYIERKLYDVEGALIAGKITSEAPVGMKAQLAAARQELLKLHVQESEYIEELKTMAGIDLTSRQISDEFKTQLEIRPLSFYLEMGETSNTDVRISELKVSKAREGIEAAKRSYLPDLGIMAAYSYQNSLKILPETNPFIGASLSWNIQDVFGNERVVKQRRLQYEQAEEHREYISRKVSSEIENAYRQLQESNELISVAYEAMRYQKENLSIEKNRYAAGLNTIVDVLNAEADHAKAESDYYSARVNYNVKLCDLFSLTENRHWP